MNASVPTTTPNIFVDATVKGAAQGGAKTYHEALKGSVLPALSKLQKAMEGHTLTFTEARNSAYTSDLLENFINGMKAEAVLAEVLAEDGQPFQNQHEVNTTSKQSRYTYEAIHVVASGEYARNSRDGFKEVTSPYETGINNGSLTQQLLKDRSENNQHGSSLADQLKMIVQVEDINLDSNPEIAGALNDAVNALESSTSAKEQFNQVFKEVAKINNLKYTQAKTNEIDEPTANPEAVKVYSKFLETEALPRLAQLKETLGANEALEALETAFTAQQTMATAIAEDKEPYIHTTYDELTGKVKSTSIKFAEPGTKFQYQKDPDRSVYALAQRPSVKGFNTDNPFIEEILEAEKAVQDPTAAIKDVRNLIMASTSLTEEQQNEAKNTLDELAGEFICNSGYDGYAAARDTIAQIGSAGQSKTRESAALR